MSTLRNLDSATGADVVGSDTTPAFTVRNTTTGPALAVNRAVVGTTSIALVNLNVSGASAAVFGLQASAFVSAVSIVFAASANWAGMGGIRVTYPDNVTQGWIPVIPNAVFTAANAS